MDTAQLISPKSVVFLYVGRHAVRPRDRELASETKNHPREHSIADLTRNLNQVVSYEVLASAVLSYRSHSYTGPCLTKGL